MNRKPKVLLKTEIRTSIDVGVRIQKYLLKKNGIYKSYFIQKIELIPFFDSEYCLLKIEAIKSNDYRML